MEIELSNIMTLCWMNYFRNIYQICSEPIGLVNGAEKPPISTTLLTNLFLCLFTEDPGYKINFSLWK